MKSFRNCIVFALLVKTKGRRSALRPTIDQDVCRIYDSGDGVCLPRSVQCSQHHKNIHTERQDQLELLSYSCLPKNGLIKPWGSNTTMRLHVEIVEGVKEFQIPFTSVAPYTHRPTIRIEKLSFTIDGRGRGLSFVGSGAFSNSAAER